MWCCKFSYSGCDKRCCHAFSHQACESLNIRLTSDDVLASVIMDEVFSSPGEVVQRKLCRRICFGIKDGVGSLVDEDRELGDE